MVEVQVLPPRSEPERLTAHHPTSNLYEHFLAFQNQNNKGGFQPEEPTVEIRLMPVDDIMKLENAQISDYLVLLAQHQYITREQLKKFAFFLKVKIREGGHKKFGVSMAYELLARLFGYKTNAALAYYSKEGLDAVHPGQVRNFRFGDNPEKAVFAAPQKGKFKSVPGIRHYFKAGEERKAQEAVKVTVKKTRKIQK